MYIEQYYEECKSGNIIVGKELMQQLDMLMYDITNRVVLNIQIDLEESNKRIRFIETKCKHFEAPYAGKPFLLELFQKAFIESIFSIKIWDEELNRYIRKYQEVLFLVGRKNGKTPLIGAICLAEWFCGPMGCKQLCASNDDSQADLMFQAINAMREESSSLERVTRKNLKGIFFGNPNRKNKKGKFSYQNKGQIKKLSARTGAKEGRNIAVGAVDEVFEMKDNTTVMPIRQALSTQDEPLYFELTTEGFTDNGYLDERLKDGRKVLRGELNRPRWLIWLYTQDDEKEIWQDEKSWYKSNPGLGKIKKWSFLRQMIDEARTNKSTKAFVLAKDFNIKQNSSVAWLSKEEVENNLAFNIEEIAGSFAIGAADLSETGDLTNARALIYNPKTFMKYTISMYFIPACKLDELENNKKEQYIKWARDGYIRITEESEVNQSDVVAWFVSIYKKYKIKCIFTGYDKWQAKAFASEMDDYGFDIEKIKQGYDLSNAMNSVEKDLLANRLNYNQNPLDVFCLKNTGIKYDSTGTKRMPVKAQNDIEAKIDGAVTLIMTYEVLDRHRKEYIDYASRR